MSRGGALLVALVLAVSGCTSDDGGDATEEPAPPPAPARIALAELATFDPALAGDRDALTVASLLFEPLAVLDPETGEPLPGVAGSWRADAAQQVFRFRVREGAEFHDGSRVTADDVVATLTRVAVPATGSPVAALLDGVMGFAELQSGAATTLAGVRAIDDERVEIELTTPDASLPIRLAHPALGIVPADGMAGLGTSPVGSGPFAFERAEGGATVLRRVDERMPVEEVRLVDAGGAQAAVDEVVAGRADLALVTADARVPDGVEVADAPFLAVAYYALDVAAGPLTDDRLRQAVVQSVDRDAVVAAAYGDAARPWGDLLPERVSGADARACAGRCDHDVDAAKAALAEAFPDGAVPTLPIDFDDTELQRNVAAELERQLEAVGIPVEPRPHPPDEYPAFLVNDEPQVFRLGWVADVPAAELFLAPVFVAGAPENVTRLDAPAVQAALDRAAGDADADARAAAYREAADAVLDAHAVIPLAQLRTRWARGPAVEGVTVTLLGTLAPESLQTVAAERTG